MERVDSGKLHEVLDKYGIANSFELYQGTHTSAVAVRFQNYVMPFFSKHLCHGNNCRKCSSDLSRFFNFQQHKSYEKKILVAAIFILMAAVFIHHSRVLALDGQIGIHDPSTIIFCDGKYYTCGTGGSSLVSDDGWTWRRGTPLPRRGLAPDVIHVGDRYYLYIAANSGPTKADIYLLSNKTLDPASPDYKWEEGGVVASSDGVEDCNAIDPGVLLDPMTKRLWLVYGSYFGYIRLVELDPQTGRRLNPNEKPRNIAINSEASIMIYHDGWYYLLVTHGSCCRGADSGYNIRVGRAKKVTGPFMDNMGVDMIQGGGKLFVGSSGRVIGPGHFGLFDLGDEVQRFSLHYEADLDRGGASVLDIRPLQWKDGWPLAGENLQAGAYQFGSVRTGTVLELAVEGFPVGGRPVRRGPPPRGSRGGRKRPAVMQVRRPALAAGSSQARANRSLRKMWRKFRRNGRRGTLTCGWATTCVRRSRSGRLSLSPMRPMQEATLVRPISKSPLPGQLGHWPRLRARNSSSCPPSPEAPNNFGVSISLRMAVGA